MLQSSYLTQISYFYFYELNFKVLFQKLLVKFFNKAVEGKAKKLEGVDKKSLLFNFTTDKI